MNDQDIKNLLNRYQAGTASEEEKLQAELWYHQQASTSDWLMNKDKKQFIFQKLKYNIDYEIDRPVKRISWYMYVAAASILVVLSFGIYFFSGQQISNQSIVKTHYKNDINPGGNKAVLTLAGGKQVILDQIQNGLVASQGKVIIHKTTDGMLVYSSKNRNAEAPFMNKLYIPRGGQYRITLPDQTKVWLNSATTLIYPTAFTGKERIVELTGEAYFEVAHNKQQPFLVKTNRQEIKVLGTHFNINAYTDEQEVKTTLMEGSILLSPVQKEAKEQPHPVLLKPGQQAVLKNNNVSVVSVDTDNAIDWKNGYFIFDNEDFESILRKIEKWYDVEIIYKQGQHENLKIGGRVSRSKNISSVLAALELTGKVKFKVEGRRVIVM